jgi:hypothetical protein
MDSPIYLEQGLYGNILEFNFSEENKEARLKLEVPAADNKGRMYVRKIVLVLSEVKVFHGKLSLEDTEEKETYEMIIKEHSINDHIRSYNGEQLMEIDFSAGGKMSSLNKEQDLLKIFDPSPSEWKVEIKVDFYNTDTELLWYESFIWFNEYRVEDLDGNVITDDFLETSDNYWNGFKPGQSEFWKKHILNSDQLFFKNHK